MGLTLVRTIVLCASNLLALLVVGFSANILVLFCVRRVISPYSILSVATSFLHLCSVTSMIIIGFRRNDAWTSYLAFEFAWLTFLWIMWLATGGYIAAIFDVHIDGHARCTHIFCYEIQVIVILACCFCIWAMLFGYTITLLTFAVQAARSGQNVWATDVKQVCWVQSPTNFEKHVLGTPHSAPHPILAPTYPPGMVNPATSYPQCPHPQCPHQHGNIYV